MSATLIRSLLTRLTLFIFNPLCLSCGLPTKRQTNLCIPCEEELPIVQHLQCKQCANRLHGPHMICGHCIKNPPPFDLTFSLFPYERPIKQWISRLKFFHQLVYAQLFAELLIKKMKENWYYSLDLPHLIIPVPLHDKRLRERGFNQALEIAKPIARQLNIPLNRYDVQRRVHTQPQSGLLGPERKRNLNNVFHSQVSFEGMTLAVMDDVITTGETIKSLCHVLKSHGAKRIDVWCCAKRI